MINRIDIKTVLNIVTADLAGGFNYKWRDILSTHPLVATMSWEEREKYKEFAWYIYKIALKDVNNTDNLNRKIEENIDEAASAF